MSNVIYPRRYHNQIDIEWEDRKTCYMSSAPQCSPLWDELHIGTISASRLASYIQLSQFSDTPEESALQCVGLSRKSFTSEQVDRTQIGIKGEPTVRDWFGKSINKPIRQVGIAVWKKDPRFRASLDGEYDEDKAIEIKITSRVYKPLIAHLQALKRGFTPPPGYHSHIWDTHYIQITQSMAVTGKTSIDYIVASYENNEIYTEQIDFNAELWERTLYPKGVEFLTTYVEPLMVQHHIKRIDPFPMEVIA